MTNRRRFFTIVALAVSAGVPLLLVPAGAQQLSDREKQIGGKFSMKTALENEAAMVLAEIEQVTESQVRRSRPPQSAPADRSTQ
jgi:hypothetical protein